MGWTETSSLSFTARHEDSQADAALTVLESLEQQRSRLDGIVGQIPPHVTVVLHDSALQLALAHPYMPLARRLAAPAGRRYMAGWFTSSEVHALAPQLLRRMAAGPESLKALMLTPERVYTQLVIGLNSELLPPPFRPRTIRSYLRAAWVAEGAAQFLCGQVQHLRAPIARRLRGRPPQLPPSLRDAALLGGSVFDLLERERGVDSAVELALAPLEPSAGQTIERAFRSPLPDVRLRWRAHLEQLATPEPGVRLNDP